MGFSRFAVPDSLVVRTGAERATLVRRTYSLVLVSIVVTMMGTWFGLSNESVLQTVARHPIIMMLLAFAPLLMAQRVRNAFPQNIAFVFLFTFAMGVMISPLIFIYSQRQPGVVAQAITCILHKFVVRKDRPHGEHQPSGAGLAHHEVELVRISGCLLEHLRVLQIGVDVHHAKEDPSRAERSVDSDRVSCHPT